MAATVRKAWAWTAAGAVAAAGIVGLAGSVIADSPAPKQHVVKNDKATPHLQKGHDAIAQNDYKLAAEHFAKAASARSSDPEVLNLYGLALSRSGKMNQAIEQFNKALVLDSHSVTTRENLAIVYIQQAEFQAAYLKIAGRDGAVQFGAVIDVLRQTLERLEAGEKVANVPVTE